MEKPESEAEKQDREGVARKNLISRVDVGDLEQNHTIDLYHLEERDWTFVFLHQSLTPPSQPHGQQVQSPMQLWIRWLLSAKGKSPRSCHQP